MHTSNVFLFFYFLVIGKYQAYVTNVRRGKELLNYIFIYSIYNLRLFKYLHRLKSVISSLVLKQFQLLIPLNRSRVKFIISTQIPF